MTDNDLEVATDVVQEKPWRLVDIVQLIGPWLSVGALLAGGASLLGYLFDLSLLYRPFDSGPSTHPLTGLCLLCLAMSTFLVRRQAYWSKIGVFLAGAVILIVVIRLCDLVFSAGLASYLTPFQSQVAHEIDTGASNSVGVNSSLMLAGVAGALLFLNTGHLGLAQTLSFLSAFIPSVSLVGYSYALDNLYGDMSLWTALGGFCVGMSVLSMTAHAGLIRSVLSPYACGWVFRTQSLFGLFVPALMGYLIIDVMLMSDERAFGVYVVGNIWFILMMVGVSAYFLEQVDCERRHSEQMLLEAATQDQLTRLANRRKFFDFGRHEIQRMSRSGNGLWLLMLDLDHFKCINDSAGHDMGDRVLVLVSRAMEKCVRNVDLVGRLGGEEFGILLPDSTRDGAERVAARIIATVRGACILGWTDIHGPITLSIGCAQIRPGGSLEEGLKRADNALYQAKRQGRDQLVFAPNWMPPER